MAGTPLPLTTTVVVDDASAPPAHEIAERWCGEAPERVLLTLDGNGGPCAARHRGLTWILDHSQDDDDVIVLMDGDDEFAHERALEVIAKVYAEAPDVQLTLGDQQRTSGLRGNPARYKAWHFRLGRVHDVPWLARCPRTFRVGLLRRVWPQLRLRWPDGSWIRRGTDQALMLPLLRAIQWHQLRQLEEVLYIYNDVRPDGATIAASFSGRVKQLLSEAYVRRSVPWSALALPRLGFAAAKKRLRAWGSES